MSSDPLVVTMTAADLRRLIRDEFAEVEAKNAQRTLLPAVSLSAKEAALCLKIPADMLRKRARRGEIRCFYIGTEMRFDVVDLEAFKEANRTPPKKRAG